MEAQVAEMIQACQLDGHENTKSGELSPGLMRRLTLGMALIGRPKLIVLDNPLHNVDPISKLELIKTIQHFSEDRTLIVATRDLQTAQLLGQKIAIMHQGEFLAIGSAGEIIEKHRKGLTLEVQINCKMLARQCSRISQKGECDIIESVEQAKNTIAMIQRGLQDEGIETSVSDYVEEFHSDGMLKVLYNELLEKKSFSKSQFIDRVIIINLALSMIELLQEINLDIEVEISSIQSELIQLSVKDKEGGMDLSSFNSDAAQVMQNLPVVFWSLKSTSLEQVFANLIQRQNFD